MRLYTYKLYTYSLYIHMYICTRKKSANSLKSAHIERSVDKDKFIIGLKMKYLLSTLCMNNDKLYVALY